MKYILLVLSVFTLSLTTKAQLQPLDTIANNADFQSKIRFVALQVANDYYGDTTKPLYVRQFAREIITSPQGGNWLIILSYGAQSIPGTVSINMASTAGNIEFALRTSLLFDKYAKAKAGIITLSQADAEQPTNQ